MTIRDFMNYLVYVEHSAENLQFYLWYKDYAERFGEAKTTDLALAPEWTKAMQDEAMQRIQKETGAKVHGDSAGPGASDIFKGTDFDAHNRYCHNDNGSSQLLRIDSKVTFSTPPRTTGEKDSLYTGSTATTGSHRSQASAAFVAAGVKQPFTIQPFREEMDRVVATYLADSAPRQLNLSSREQRCALAALAYTTHPSALAPVAEAVELTLRRQAHPNFVRWSICNGNRARVVFARGLGVATVAIGLGVAAVLTLGSAPRAYRALAAVAWLLGFATLFAAAKGMCVVLHGLHHRHVRPWELFVDADDCGGEMGCKDGDAAGANGTAVSDPSSTTTSTPRTSSASLDTFGAANSYEDEPWVVRYRRRNLVRKVFDREVWIQEPALRQIQDTIFLQAVLAGALGAAVLTALFVPLPAGRFF